MPHAIPAAPKMSKKDREREQRWEAESDIRALAEAEEIRSDPERIARAGRLLEEQREAIERTGRGRQRRTDRRAT